MSSLGLNDWQALPEGGYFIEWRERGKRKRQAAGQTASDALEAVRRQRMFNIIDLQTRLAAGVYVMVLELVIPEGADVRETLAAVGREQGVDVSLRELDEDTLS